MTVRADKEVCMAMSQDIPRPAGGIDVLSSTEESGRRRIGRCL